MFSPLPSTKTVQSVQSAQSHGSHFGDISDLIQQKESELRGIHEMRCTQLENMVSERDTLLLESSKRFDQLKDDFQYNLALLDARDKEIQRLEAVAESGTLRIKELDIDKKSLLGKIETLMQNENMRINQFDQEKANNKKRLLQLKEEIEHTVWTSGETLKSKERDLTSLRVELTQQKAEYEEQIESQRNDLTKTFERLLQQREDSFKEKERQIGGQIDTLSYKFEHLKNENTRLKTESVEQKRRADLLHEENELKDENYRKLLWKMDDERAAMQRSEDAFQRNLQQLTMQISEAKAEAEKAGAEGQREIDLARNDCQREKELRHSAEKIVEDTRRKFFDEETRYQRELSEGRSREEVLMHEINSLRMERDDALNRLTHGKAEIDAITLQHRGLMRDLGSTKDDLLLTSKILEETEARLRTQEAQAEQDREAAIQALEVSESRARDEMFSFKDDAMHIQDKLKGDFEKARAQLKAEHEEHVRESNRVFDEKIKQLKSKLDEATSETARFRIQLGERDHELSEEKAEAAALKLRIRLHESQATASKDQIDRLQRHVDQSLLSPQQHASDSVRDSMRSSYGSDPERGSGIGFGRQSSFSYGKVPESPMFSEDFGPASVPLSPEPTPNRKFSFETRPMLHPNNYTDMSPSRMHAYGAYTGGAYAGGSPTGFQNGRSPPAIATIHEGLPAASPLTTEDPIVMENERLKTIIKDMRADVENLQDQLANSPRRSPSHNGSSPEHMPGEVPAHVLSPKRLGIDADGDAQLVARQMAENHDMGGISGVSGTSGVSNEGSNGSSAQNKPWHDNNAARVRDLECKLEQTASEVCRLRQERRRLMDVGNELRAAVNRTQMSRSFDQADFSAIYDASPGTMASSKNGHDRPSTAPYGAMSASHKERVEQYKMRAFETASQAALRGPRSASPELYRDRSRSGSGSRKGGNPWHGVLRDKAQPRANDYPQVVGGGINTSIRGIEPTLHKSLRHTKMSDRATNSQKNVLASLSKKSVLTMKTEPRKVVNYATEFKA